MNTDTASVAIERNAEAVFKFMSDPNKMDLWSFGSWRISVDGDGLVHGRSIFDGSTACVRIEPDAQNRLIDYCIGTTPENLEPRIFVRVTPGEVTGSSALNCILSMVAFRTEAMSDDRWRRLVTAHAFEVQLIKSLLENDFDHRKMPSSGATQAS